MSIKPLLIGVIKMSAGESAVNLLITRAVLALQAQHEGYSLVEIFDVTGDDMADEPVYAAIEDLADRADPSALMAVGLADMTRVHEIARRAGLPVTTLPTHRRPAAP